MTFYAFQAKKKPFSIEQIMEKGLRELFAYLSVDGQFRPVGGFTEPVVGMVV